MGQSKPGWAGNGTAMGQGWARMGQNELLMRRIAVVVFVTLMTILGAMVLPSIVWIFTLGLPPQWVAYVLAIPGGWGVGYVAYQHTVDKDWTFVPPRDKPPGDVGPPVA